MTICVKCKYHEFGFVMAANTNAKLMDTRVHYCGHQRHYRVAPSISPVTGEAIGAVMGRCEDINMGNCPQYEANP